MKSIFNILKNPVHKCSGHSHFPKNNLALTEKKIKVNYFGTSKEKNRF
jgi:hypothetical protein